MFQFTNCSVNGAAPVACGATVNGLGNAPGDVDFRVSVLDAFLGNAATVTGSALTVTLSNSAPGNYSISANPTIAVGASESSVVTVTHLNNASNSTVVATTNAGFTQDSVTISK